MAVGSRQVRTQRTAWGSISREQIVDTAVRLLKERGFEQITIRAIAAEMDVSPMSLYRHVRDKDDILDEVVERLLARVWRPRGDPGAWKEWTLEASDRLRKFLVAQPAALHVYLNHPVVSPSAITRMEAMIQVLRTELGEEDAARRAYGAVHTYTVGFAALEAARLGWKPQGVDPVGRRLAAFATPKQFAVGLRYLLDGIESGARTG